MANKSKRCVIVGGANIENYEKISQYLRDDDFFIFCDSGLSHQNALGVQPDLIVGDFDSHPQPNVDIETIVLPVEKDDTDTVYGVKEAVKRGFQDFLLLGVVGKRLDHSLGNVSILLYIDSLGMNGAIIDDYSYMEIISHKPAFVEDEYPYFSLLNISGKAEGITIENAKYPLYHAKICCEYQYGISNEVIPGKTARITVDDGKLLLIKVFSEL